MSVTAQQKVGKRRSPITATVATAGTNVAHRGTHRPVYVEGYLIGTSSSAAVLTYDRAASDATNMKLYSSVDLQSWILIPVFGQE